ncbi:phage antirepressor KilAC domain-containing protein [Herbaspirillum chlorophenolicum]|uniref:phage antirepressor KilAC domain-containing protein n=1 Tax=Herbaspirillum chlorophenolicum TaxID=211589 RepID=UPI00067BB5AE|nr:phage regulatory protein/antirepressor Ant [Herbaspirillum chlorophenolicum]
MTSEKKKAVALAGVTAFDTTVHSQNYIAAIGFVQTMSSREIADLVEKRHDNVMRDIRLMLVELHGEAGILNFEDTFLNEQNGQVYPIFRLPKREALILVSGYKLELRARIIDRWQELEGGISVPRTFSAALRLAASQQEQLEYQARQIAYQAPKVEFATSISNSDGLCKLGVFAKAIGWGQNRFFRQLRSDEVLMQNNIPYQRFVDRGYFRVVERKPWSDSAGHEHITFTTMITGIGQEWLAKRYAKEGA